MVSDDDDTPHTPNTPTHETGSPVHPLAEALHRAELADLILTIIGLQLRGFKGNLVFDLLAAHNIVVGALLWIGLTLLMVANMVIAYTAPSAQKWARREAMAVCTIMVVIVASDAWSLLHLHTRSVLRERIPDSRQLTL